MSPSTSLPSRPSGSATGLSAVSVQAENTALFAPSTRLVGELKSCRSGLPPSLQLRRDTRLRRRLRRGKRRRAKEDNSQKNVETEILKLWNNGIMVKRYKIQEIEENPITKAPLPFRVFVIALFLVSV